MNLIIQSAYGNISIPNNHHNIKVSERNLPYWPMCPFSILCATRNSHSCPFSYADLHFKAQNSGEEAEGAHPSEPSTFSPFRALWCFFVHICFCTYVMFLLCSLCFLVKGFYPLIWTSSRSYYFFIQAFWCIRFHKKIVNNISAQLIKRY